MTVLNKLLLGCGAALTCVVLYSFLRPTPDNRLELREIEAGTFKENLPSGISEASPPPSVPTIHEDSVAYENILINRLRGAYTSNDSKATRFRLQHELDIRWGGQPPVETLIGEAIHPDASTAYRTHFANRLRAHGKRAEPEERTQLSGLIRESLEHDRAGIAALSKTLIQIDDRPENIAAIRGLIEQTQDDSQTAGLLSAIILSHTPEAKQTLIEQTETLLEAPDSYPRSLSIALPTLARIPDVKIESSLARALTTTSNPTVYELTIASIIARQPSQFTLQLLQSAKEDAQKFDSDTQHKISSRIDQGLFHWSEQSHRLPPNIIASLDALID